MNAVAIEHGFREPHVRELARYWHESVRSKLPTQIATQRRDSSLVRMTPDQARRR